LIVIVRQLKANLCHVFLIASNCLFAGGVISQTIPVVPFRAEHAVNSEADELLKQATELFAKENYQAALVLLQHYLSIKEKRFRSRRSESGRYPVHGGRRLPAGGGVGTSLAVLQRSLGIKERVFGKDSPDLVPVLLMLGLTCQAENLTAVAVDYFERFW
jgi:hypothetical protein